MTKLPEDYKEMLLSIAEELDGTIHYTSTLDHTGRTSDKVTIEYNVKQKD